MNDKFYSLHSEDDVFELKEKSPDDVIVGSSMTFRTRQLSKQIIANLLGKSNEELETPRYAPRKKWIEEGLDCEVLTIGSKQWKQGKIQIKVTVEFCPDEPEIPSSPLDDIRKEMNQS
jgi:hypothetical protein